MPLAGHSSPCDADANDDQTAGRVIVYNLGHLLAGGPLSKHTPAGLTVS